MGKAFECDYCKTLVKEIYRIGPISVSGLNDDTHFVTVVVTYNGDGKGEYCLECIPKILRKTIKEIKGGGNDSNEGRKRTPECDEIDGVAGAGE